VSRAIDLLLTDLRYLIADLGADGGLMGPSIYDTAQVLRLCPPAEGAWPALNWLVDQQQADGGWGDPRFPLTRDVPTLAAVLALHTYGMRARERLAVHTGLAFLRRQAGQWGDSLPEELPVGVELLLPRLLDEAATAGLELPHAPYAGLIALGKRRRQMIARMNFAAGTTAVHSWEAWGSEPYASLVDGFGGVGHSPAATAAWLRAAAGRADLVEERRMAQSYLERASAATGVGIAGVVPTAHPIARFEQAFALYALLLAGLLDHPALVTAIQPIIDELARALRPEGLGYSDLFTPDGDDTAVAIAVLRASGQPTSAAALEQFRDGDHYVAWVHELQPAVSVTAHALHALALCDAPAAQQIGPQSYLAAQQRVDGSWAGDKWNSSWYYTTTHALIALMECQHPDAVLPALRALLDHQRADGGWGLQRSDSESTAYVVLALRGLDRHGILDTDGRSALALADRWLFQQYRPFTAPTRGSWLAKEPHCPSRIDRMFELAALAASALAEEAAR
jgi:hypothetical protein